MIAQASGKRHAWTPPCSACHVATLSSTHPQPRPFTTCPTNAWSSLQKLYDSLHAAYSKSASKSSSRPRSGLTMVDHVQGTGTHGSLDAGTDAGGSWWSGLRSAVMGGSSDGTLGRHRSSSSMHGTAEPAVKGLYMYGGVGCGKTMLMDLFVDTTPPHFKVSSLHWQSLCYLPVVWLRTLTSA